MPFLQHSNLRQSLHLSFNLIHLMSSSMEVNCLGYKQFYFWRQLVFFFMNNYFMCLQKQDMNNYFTSSFKVALFSQVCKQFFTIIKMPFSKKPFTMYCTCILQCSFVIAITLLHILTVVKTKKKKR